MPRIPSSPNVPEWKGPPLAPAAQANQTQTLPSALISTPGLQPFSVLAPVDNTRVAPQGQARLLQSFVEADPVSPPLPAAPAAKPDATSTDQAGIAALEKLKPAELHKLGRKDPAAFFKALLPAALESERRSGAPAVMTLVQAAVESDFARSPIGGYNIFGIKGEGPAGTIRLRTREVIKGKNHYVKEPFAKYHNFYEAVREHGKLYNNGHYDKAMAQYAKDKDVMKFVDGVAKIYATDPKYARTLKTRIEEYGLLEMVAAAR